ncbi:hypothetical protein [Bordetella avium]|uniref:hypothetical protein n=1 Tax=Bordetella avium TaxID=521 RepID=UPI000E6A6835|nr:hypothetical protein [Bordetella avium]RIQ51016.1 hypothetical protein D0843_11020 [Bordetella avium]
MTNQTWQPIATAPKNQLVMVYTPPQPSDWPDSVRIGFDYIDPEVADDYWYNHGEHYEHYCCVAKPENCTGPGERAPYTHWMPIPPAPGAEDATAVPAQPASDQLPSPAVSAEPVAWFIDWPDEPELGHYLGENQCDGARNRALVFRDASAPPAADERAPVGDERATFEKRFSVPPDTWSVSGGGGYRDIWVETRWEGWKARAALASAHVAGENGAQSTQNRPESRANTGYTGGSLAPVAGEVNAALDEWLDKTDFIQERIASGDLPVKYLGWHRADAMRDLIDGSKTEPLNAAPQASTAADARHTPAPDWMSCESRRPWVIDSLAHQAKKLRRKERGCRISFRKDYMGVPVRYLADAYGEAAAVFEARIAAIAAQQGKGGEV